MTPLREPKISKNDEQGILCYWWGLTFILSSIKPPSSVLIQSWSVLGAHGSKHIYSTILNIMFKNIYISNIFLLLTCCGLSQMT